MFMKKNIGGPYASESDENVKAARGRRPSDMRERVGGSWWRAMNESRYL